MPSKPSTTTPLAKEYFFSGHITFSKDTESYEIKSWSLHPRLEKDGKYMPQPGADRPEAVPLAPEAKSGESRGSAVDTQKDARVRMPKLRVETDIPLPLFPTKANQDPSASSLTKFQESLERMMPHTPRVKHRIPEIQINGQAIGEENKARQRELSSPVREWLEKRGDKSSAREKGKWIEMWK